MSSLHKNEFGIVKKKISASKQIDRCFKASNLGTTLGSTMRPKHKKILAGGRQLKTHMKCIHVDLEPVWGRGSDCCLIESQENRQQKEKEYVQKRINKKIESLCKLGRTKQIGPVFNQEPRHDILRDEDKNGADFKKPVKTHIQCKHFGNSKKQCIETNRIQSLRPSSRKLHNDVNEKEDSASPETTHLPYKKILISRKRNLANSLVSKSCYSESLGVPIIDVYPQEELNLNSVLNEGKENDYSVYNESPPHSLLRTSGRKSQPRKSAAESELLDSQNTSHVQANVRSCAVCVCQFCGKAFRRTEDKKQLDEPDVCNRKKFLPSSSRLGNNNPNWCEQNCCQCCSSAAYHSRAPSKFPHNAVMCNTRFPCSDHDHTHNDNKQFKKRSRFTFDPHSFSRCCPRQCTSQCCYYLPKPNFATDASFTGDPLKRKLSKEHPNRKHSLEVPVEDSLFEKTDRASDKLQSDTPAVKGILRSKRDPSLSVALEDHL